MRFSNSLFFRSVQIAGVKSLEEGQLLEELGVDFIGFPLRLGFHTPDISEDEARDIIGALKRPDRAVLITYLKTAAEVIQFAEFLGVQIVQLHDEIPASEVRLIKEVKRHLTLIKSLVVRPQMGSSAQELNTLAFEYESSVDAFITDTFDPKTKATGATGLVHDWEVSRRLALELTKPLILAGGLKPTNVAEGIARVNPTAVDAHSGVERRDGTKCPTLIADFIAQSRRRFSME